MSFDRVPSKVEVMGWKPHQLSDYMKRMDLTGCDKVVLKYCMNGARFLNMSENDLQKFPKLHAPLISKICREISRKEEKKRLFGNRSTPKYHEPETPVEGQCWGPDEFDVSDDDYESPNADDDDAQSVGDYESPTEDFEQNESDYEPPPSEPQDDIQSQFAAALHIGDSEYIDRVSSHAKPPVVQPRPGPPTPAPARPGLMEPPPLKREQSPQRPGRLTLPTKILPGLPAPQVDRSKKPSAADRGPNVSPLLVRRPSPVAQPVTHSQSWRSPPEERGGLDARLPKPPLPATSVSRSSSSVVRGTGPRFVPNSRTEVQEEGASPKWFNSNTFPLNSASRGMAPRPHGPSGPPTHSDSLPPPSSTGSLPLRLQEAMNSHRSSARMGQSVPLRPPVQASYPPPPPVQASYPPPHPVQASYPPPHPVQASYPPPPDRDSQQGMDTRWYVGQVTRKKAEGCLREVNKDGAFLVRDSSKGQWEQPYTLMVLYQDKVFNIQVKRLNDLFLLGTGLNAHETFPSVSEMISHYQQMPLLLIDTKNRSAPQQNQCPLMYPAGF